MLARRHLDMSSIVLSAVLLASPAFAQDATAEAVGTAVGGVIGIVLLIVIGAIVGWLASLIVKGSGSGFLADVLFGIGGALLAGYVLPVLGITIGGTIGSFFAALIGAVVLILVFRAIRKAA